MHGCACVYSRLSDVLPSEQYTKLQRWKQWAHQELAGRVGSFFINTRTGFLWSQGGCGFVNILETCLKRSLQTASKVFVEENVWIIIWMEYLGHVEAFSIQYNNTVCASDRSFSLASNTFLNEVVPTSMGPTSWTWSLSNFFRKWNPNSICDPLKLFWGKNYT